MKMLDKEEKEKVRPQYFKMLRRIGWTVAFDANEDLDNPIMDISVFLTGFDVDEETKKKIPRYGFLEVTYNSPVSYDAYRKAWLSKSQDLMPKLIDEVHSLIYPYELDDVIAQLLHLGYHIQDVYTVQDGKLALNLDEDKIKAMIHQFVTQNSPLLDPISALKPKKLKGRQFQKTFWNVEKFGKTPQ
jgi:hypothetical protein